jgi:hypothetical protein
LKSLGIQHKYLQPCIAECPSLKINILKDSFKPDGDIENGALLSASELHACGYFVNFSSDTAPVPVSKTKEVDDDLKDKSYQLLKCGNVLDNEEPECIYISVPGKRLQVRLSLVMN